MDEKPRRSNNRKKIKLGSEKLRTFFISHLNRIYHAKAHLIARLPQIANESHFNDLKEAIVETINAVERQMIRMEMIYELLDEPVAKENAKGLVGLVDDAFEAIKQNQQEHELRDMAILFYMQNIEGMEMTSFQVLQMAAVKLKNKQIKTLLKENYEDAKADRTLLLMITSKYLTA
jgi:ferritin-like metal-binding protein YciE